MGSLRPVEVRAFVLALLVAAAFRLPQLDDNPNGFFCDEASAGYDAVALLETGRDQYGRLVPAFARSFGDYDEASYRYLIVPFVAALGPTVAAARLPAALAGIVSVVLLFFLARRTVGWRAAIASAFLLAISPWHVLFSRMAFRGVLFPLAFLAFALLWVRSRERPREVIWAAVAASLALWTYSPARVIVPIAAVVLLVLEGRERWRRDPRAMMIAGAMFASTLALLATFWLSPEGMARASSELRPDLQSFARSYVTYFSPAFLFESGDPNLRHSLRDWGQLHRFEIVTVGLGLLAVLRARRRDQLLILGWLALAPVPAALTAESHALRAILAAPAWALLGGIGIAAVIERVRRVPARQLVATVSAATMLLGAGALGRALYVDYPRYSTGAWQWGMREIVHTLEGSGRPCYVVTNRIFLPHIFVLYFGRVPPAEYQAHPIETITQDDMSYSHYDIGPWRIRPIRQAIRDSRECAFVAFPDEYDAVRRDPALRSIDSFSSPEGQRYFELFQFDDPSRSDP